LVIPSQVSATSQIPFCARQTVPRGATASTGQVSDVPLHFSATSQAPFCARQTVVLDAGEHVPTFPDRLQTPHPPLQAVSQQTPFTQNPVAHWLFDVQARANDASYRSAVATVVEPFTPPAMSTMLLGSTVAVSLCTGAGSALVAVQMLVPFQSSAVPSVLAPLFPPATRT
jgi:hypothetical protein